jgi:type II secretory pathway pseudopilin PulG
MKNRKEGKKKRGCLIPVVIVIVLLIIIMALAGGGSSDSTDAAKETIDQAVEYSASSFTEELETKSGETSESAHIYDNAEIKDVMNGTHSTKLGEYSIITVDSSECTEEVIADWYFNYVIENDYNWCMIIYSDQKDNSGIYAIKGYIDTDVIFDVDKYGDYSIGDSSNSTTYVPDGESTLKILE